MECPSCKHTENQSKSGFTKAGSQRYVCKFCGKRYTPKPKHHGYSRKVRLQAVGMYVDGMGFRQIGRHLQVDHVTVMNWVRTYASHLVETDAPKQAYAVEMDELYTFIGKKKTGSTS
ncbi:MAG TPA: helix-turn-helix domain-containing protein [Anaerolineales bacterium]|nr:helix-turn-helix domain-containing protein [Anaerolineales bacterium]